MGDSKTTHPGSLRARGVVRVSYLTSVTTVAVTVVIGRAASRRSWPAAVLFSRRDRFRGERNATKRMIRLVSPVFD
jgi:hypothetical protein